jgi:PAS domain S-box-containing protein
MNTEEESTFKPDHFFYLSSNPMAILNKDFRFLEGNDSMKTLIGVEETSIHEHVFVDFVHTDDRTSCIQHLQQLLLQETNNIRFESKLVSLHDETKWMHWEVFTAPQSSVLYLSGFEVTEDRITRSVVEEHMDKLLQIIELVPHPIFLKDSNARYILVNQAQADLFSTTRKNFIGRDDSFFIKNEKEINGINESDHTVLNERQRILLAEQEITHPNGQKRILYTSKIPFFSNFSGEVNILGVSIDITDIKNSENELRKINFELDSFIYHASHDLRAPLCSIEGLLNLINVEQDESIRQKCVEEGIKSIKRLDGFISDLTNLSRNSRLEVKPVQIKFKKIIHRTLANLKYMQNAERVNVSVHVQKDANFYSDKQRMKIIFMNLISNALKYQKPDSTNPYITVSVYANEEYSEIEIRDNGVGIENKYQQKVFEMFFRGTVLSTGSGLGLYITKEITAKLGGTIHLDSKEQEGTTFRIRIPNLIREQGKNIADKS